MSKITKEKLELLPCPFCGAGEIDINETPLNLMPRMDGKPSPIVSVEIRHWCGPLEGMLGRLNVRMAGRDKASAIAAWNRRAPSENIQ